MRRNIVILELALIQTEPERADAFEAAVHSAIHHVTSSKGYVSHELRRCIETPGRFALLIRWQTLEDHTVGFRESPAFPAWRAVVGPFFAKPPLVEHYTLVE